MGLHTRPGNIIRGSLTKHYLKLASQNGSLPTVETTAALKAGEAAFYCEPAGLYETRAVRSYQSGFVGFRVAKGVYVGGSQGRSVSRQQLKQLDAGTLTVTNKRIIFQGTGETRMGLIANVIGTAPYIDAVEVNLENRQKAWTFTAGNPFLLMAIIDAIVKQSE